MFEKKKIVVWYFSNFTRILYRSFFFFFSRTTFEDAKMYSARTFVIIATLVTIAKAAGIGKAWEVSPVQSTDRPSILSARPRLQPSAFEVRSVSGIGRLAPAFADQEEFPTKLSTEDGVDELSSSPEGMEEKSGKPISEEREAKELDDLGASTMFVPAIDFHDPTIEDFLKRSKEATEVEALPSMWRKLRSHSRTGRKQIGHCSEVEEIDEPSNNESFDLREEKSRRRRETEPEMEKIAGSKNVRQARLGSPESWSTQPLSVEFRHGTKLEEAAEEEAKLARSTAHGLHAPQVDFVTSNRRSFTESRQSRDMVLPPASSRSYDEIPIYRNTLRDRDTEAPYARGLLYPDRYRTERDYFVRGLSEPAYQQDRYREVDFDLYGRSRPMPKPKRIIYYATLPEIVRKPVDLRNYPRPYDPLTRSTNPRMTTDAYYKRRSGSTDPMRYRYYAYPPQTSYENYDRFAKRPSWTERAFPSYTERMEDSRRREQDLDHASMKDNSRTEESMLELGHERKMPERAVPRDQEKMPWPVQIGTEVSVKENERITGRKIFSQREDYDRFRTNGRLQRELEKSGPVESRN